MSYCLQVPRPFNYNRRLRSYFINSWRVYYQGLQTRENNKNHSSVGLVIFIVKHSRTIKITRPDGLVIFIVHSCFSQTLEYNENHSDHRPNDFHCFFVFVTPGNTFALVYEIIHQRTAFGCNAIYHHT